MSIGAPPPPFTDAGGAVQRRVTELSREQARAGHDVTVLCPGERDARAQIDGVHIRYLSTRSPAPWAHLEFQARCLGSMARRSARPDVLHVHNEPEIGLGARPMGVPAVLSYDNFHFRGAGGVRLRPLYRRSLASYRLLLPVSEYCRTTSTAHWDLPAERVRVLPNGVDLEQFAPDPDAAAREHASFEGPVVLYLGRICRQKGVHTLLDAAGRLARSGARADVVLAGPIGEFDDQPRPAQTSEWERAIADAGAHYVGRVPDGRLRGLLSMADVFVMPTVELEMQGMAALEAQACGTPVVASDHGGLRETVPADCGVRFPPGDAGALAAAITGMLSDASARDAFSARGLEHARSLSWSRIVERAMPLYEQARGA